MRNLKDFLFTFTIKGTLKRHHSYRPPENDTQRRQLLTGFYSVDDEHIRNVLISKIQDLSCFMEYVPFEETRESPTAGFVRRTSGQECTVHSANTYYEGYYVTRVQANHLRFSFFFRGVEGTSVSATIKVKIYAEPLPLTLDKPLNLNITESSVMGMQIPTLKQVTTLRTQIRNMAGTFFDLSYFMMPDIISFMPEITVVRQEGNCLKLATIVFLALIGVKLPQDEKAKVHPYISGVRRLKNYFERIPIIPIFFASHPGHQYNAIYIGPNWNEEERLNINNYYFFDCYFLPDLPFAEAKNMEVRGKTYVRNYTTEFLRQYGEVDVEIFTMFSEDFEPQNSILKVAWCLDTTRTHWEVVP